MDTKHLNNTLKQYVEQARTQHDNAAKSGSLIRDAHNRIKLEEQRNAETCKTLTTLAEQHNIAPQALAESITHLLAHIANKAEKGEEIKLLHVNSIAALLAGVDVIANALPQVADEQRRANTIKVLATAGLNEYGDVNGATIPVINAGAKNETIHNKYIGVVRDYMNSVVRGQPQGQELVMHAKQLQQKIDQAMRSTTPTRPIVAAGPSSPGYSPKG